MLLLYYLEPRGRFLDRRSWLDGQTSCVKCSLRIPLSSGIICGNFGCRETEGSVCVGAWHRSCYQQHVKDGYPVLSIMDLNDSLIDDGTMVSDDLLRFKERRDGDHLMTPFQCDTCHFVNIQRRLPVHGCPQDDLLLLTIRRVTLDSLWSRERGSV